jgi:dihydroorotase-like cyclic amidohydrolase
VAIAGVGAIALETGLKVHVVHVSSKAGLRVGREAIAAGAPLTLETCPQYLWLTEGDYDRVGTPMKVYPPIRTAEDQAALRDALFNGEIELVATDHAPFTDAEKGAGLNDSPAGSPGVQSLLVSVLQLARQRGDLGDAVRWVSERPARLLGLYPRKGAIQPGADADLALVDPHGTTEVKAELMHSRQRHAALEGMSFDFAVRSVYSRGELVAKEGSPVGAPGRGRLLKPAGR